MTVPALRRVTLGGSIAAAACGVDPYLSPVMLWAQLTGRAERPETEAMRWGKAMEPLIIAELEERGYDIATTAGDFAEGLAVTDPARAWLVGHPDGFTADGVLEIKTANQWAHRNGWSADVPVAYQAQAQVYTHLTGRKRTLLACLVGGSRLEVHTIEHDEHAIGLLLAGMENFMRYVRRDRQPPTDGSDSTRDALVHYLYPEAEPSKLVRLDREHWQLVRELRARKEQRKRIEAQEQALQNRLIAFAGDAELAISPHDTDAFSLKTVRTPRIDTTALREQRPEVAAEYEKVTTTRRFTLL